MVTDVVIALSRPKENIMAEEEARIVEEKKKDESEVNVDRMEVEKTLGKVKKRRNRKRPRKEVKVRWMSLYLPLYLPVGLIGRGSTVNL